MSLSPGSMSNDMTMMFLVRRIEKIGNTKPACVTLPQDFSGYIAHI